MRHPYVPSWERRRRRARRDAWAKVALLIPAALCFLVAMLAIITE